MQFKLRNPMVPSILLCDVRNMFKYAFSYKHFSIPCIQKNEMSYTSDIFYISGRNLQNWFIVRGTILSIPAFSKKKIVVGEELIFLKFVE